MTRRDRLRRSAASVCARVLFMLGFSWLWCGVVVVVNLISAVTSAVSGHYWWASFSATVAVPVAVLIARNRRWQEATPTGRVTAINHRGGIPWDETPAPLPWHHCTAWTYGYHWRDPLYGSDVIDRCRCGAIRTKPSFLDPGGPWKGKNSRKDD